MILIRRCAICGQPVRHAGYGVWLHQGRSRVRRIVPGHLPRPTYQHRRAHA